MNHDTDAVRFLSPRSCRLFVIHGVLRMTLEGDRSWLKVEASRAFPISDASHYIGFLDGNGKDIGMIQDPAELDSESRVVLDEELRLRYFVPVVRSVYSVKEEFGSIYWDVETDRGRKEVVVRNVRDNMHEIGGGRVMVTDVDGNRFEFSDVGRLDSKSQDLILRNQ